MDAQLQRSAHYGENFNKELDRVLKIHGKRTRGFYKREREKLKEKLSKGK